MSRYAVARLEELDRFPVQNGLEWRPIRRRLGIRAFGVNAYTAEKPGDWVVEEHREGSGHEELYLVVRGRARFVLDGHEVDAPRGTIVFLPDSGVVRVAYAEEEGTTVLAVGGWPAKAFEPSGWEWAFEAYGHAANGDLEHGLTVMHEALEQRGEEPPALYHLACLEARAGRNDASLAHLRRALELDPSLEEPARRDEDLTAIVEAL